MNRRDSLVWILTVNLVPLGVFLGFFLALLQGIEYGKWGYMWVFLAVMVVGGVAVAVMVKQLFSYLKSKEERGHGVLESEEKVG